MVSNIKKTLFIVCLIPAIWLVISFVTNQLGANPIEALTRETGLWALRFLWLTLLITPLRRLTGWKKLVRFRRLLGLYVFFYAVLHMLLYLGLDQFFEINEIIKDIIKRPFISIGFFSFIALIPLVITSNNVMIKRMGGRRWKQLHRLIYLIAITSSIHFYMLVKFDKAEPLIYIGLLIILLIPRVYSYAKTSDLKL